MIDFVFRSYTSVVSQLTERIFTGENARPLRDRLLKAATGTFGLRLVSTGFSFIISVILARLLGAAGYGVYSYVMAWVVLLAVPSLFGLDRLLVREVAIYRTRSEWHFMKGLLRWANRTALMISLGVSLLAAMVIWVVAGRLGVQMVTPFLLGLLILPLLTLVDVRQAALQGLNHVVVALMPEFFVRPLFLVALLGCAYLLLGDDLNPQWVLGLNGAAVVVSLLGATFLLQKMLPQAARDASPAYQTNSWMRSAWPMVLISGMNVINHRADTLMLGAMAGTEAVGIYTVAERGAHLIALIQTAGSVALAPTIASLHAAGQMGRLQRVITKSSRVVLLVSVSIALVLVLFGHKFLSIFGPEFVQAYPTLAILTAGYVVNTAAGMASLVLMMTGHERSAAMSVGVGVILNVALNAAFIPKWGVEGAATGTSISMMVRNILTAILVYRTLGIQSTALGEFSVKRKA